jgi:hypothetical protein
VQIEELRKIRNLPISPQAQGGRHKEALNTANNCAGSSDKDGSTSEDGMTKGTTGEQIQKMQDKADFIFKLQRELQQDIQVFKLNRLWDSGTNSNMINTGNKRWAPHTTAVPDQVIQAHNRGTKRQVGGTLEWKQTPPEPDEPRTRVTKQGTVWHWCPHHNLWTWHKPCECKIRPDPDQDQGVVLKGAQKKNF